LRIRPAIITMTLSWFSSARVATSSSALTRSQSLRLCSISTKRHSLEEFVEEASGGRDVGSEGLAYSARGRRALLASDRQLIRHWAMRVCKQQRRAVGLRVSSPPGIVADYGGEHDRALACFRDGFEACIARLVKRCLAPPTAPFSHHAATPKPPRREHQIWACWLVAQSRDHPRG
jgi:hypothetical protein